MGKLDLHLQRLLKMAAAAKEEEVGSAPFGFETRVLAHLRAWPKNENGELGRFVRRVAFIAIAVTVLSGAAVYRQISEEDELNEPLTNDYAIADSMIERHIGL
jgi:hypothetical protein